ncbi:MAG: acyltransferase [Candidatus Micrarchaeota archaeon]
MHEGVKIHATADVSPKAKIGKGTSVWNNAQIRENAVIGVNCNIGKDVYIDFGVKIGSNVKIQNSVSVYNGVEIEDDVFLGPHSVTTNDLRPRAAIWDESRLGKTLIKKGASVGANAVVICGTKEKPRVLGEYCLVGAGAVVTKDVPAHGLVVGNPARLIGFVCKCGAKAGEKTMKCGGCEKK